MQPTKTQAIKRFLEAKTFPDLARLYSFGMEVQANVAQDGGERVDGDFKGRQWHGWTDGAQVWKSFRIPFKANSDPEYTDSPMSFDLEAHVEGIGMTGWCWEHRQSIYFGYDFDAITGHSDRHAKKLTDEEMKRVLDAATKIDWVTIRRSASGKGLHLYVTITPTATRNHNEHAALARAILAQMSALVGYDFKSKVDICGGNMWVWHRKMLGTNGLELIKQGSVLEDIPSNWQDHIKVTSGKRRKNLPGFVEEVGKDRNDVETLFEELSGQRARVTLDDDHKKLLAWLTEKKAQWWWDADHHMMVCHTYDLKMAHEELGLRGIFETISVGKEKGADHNCFTYPLRRGAWSVRRFSPGCKEADTWNQDSAGWTQCYFNKEPDLQTAARSKEGIENKSGAFVFQHAEQAVKAAEMLGTCIDLPNAMMSRTASLKIHKDGRLLVEVEKGDRDLGDEMKGWLPEKGKWQRIYNLQSQGAVEQETGNYDDMVRHLISETGEDCGWVLKSGENWANEPVSNIKDAIKSLGFKTNDTIGIIGGSVLKPWKLVNKPFQPEYTGDREWNRKAAQFRFVISENQERKYPSWLKILEHCGAGMNEALANNGWAKANGIKTGADYLKIWIASLFQQPMEPLPYLFFYGPQNSGKSIFHEAIAKLMTAGVERADTALTNSGAFNGELVNAILCVIEETDLRKNKQAYNKIKDWVTSVDIQIHSKGVTPYCIPNKMHFIQCANDHCFCPIFSGDTRITVIYVGSLQPIDQIPKKFLFQQLEAEAPDFLAEILSLEIPPSNDRLNVPVITTEEKISAAESNQTAMQLFIAEKTHRVNGYMISIKEFCDRFHEWLDPSEVNEWSKIRIGRELPPEHPKGRNPKDGHFNICNISWEPKAPLPKLLVKDGKIVCSSS